MANRKNSKEITIRSLAAELVTEEYSVTAAAGKIYRVKQYNL